jgi:tetratricopeptide (TPR) repeat protein
VVQEIATEARESERYVAMSLNIPPLFSLLVVLSLITPSAQRNSVAKTPSKQNEPKLDANPPLQNNVSSSKQHALALLDELVGQTKNFVPGLFRPFRVSLVQADIANLLWDYDQARAHSIFETAFKSAETMRPKANASRAQNSPIATYHLEVEKEILEYVLGRDVRFAEALAAFALKASEAAGPKGTEPDWAFRSEQAILYSQIARSVAATDPQHAAELVRTSFNGWFGADQVIALNSLRRQAPKLSDEIFLYALTVLGEKPTNLSNKVAILASYAFPEINIQTNFYIRKAGGSPNQPDASPSVRKSFLEFVYETFMQQPVASQTAETSGFGTASFDSFTMRELLSRFDQDLPDKAPAIRARVKEITGSIKKAGRQDMFDSESEAFAKAFRGNVQELINKAEAAKDQTEKDNLYTEAAGLLAYRDGDLDQALSLLGKVSEGTTKSSLIAEIRQSRTVKAINDGDPDKAYVYCKDEQDLERRSDLLTRIARLLVNRGKRERAKTVWDEAFQAAKALEAGWGQTHEMLELVTVAAEIHPEMGFEAMKATIEVMNNANVGSTNDGYSRGAGEKIQFFGRFDFDESLGLLARADFERALQLARTVRSSEVSMLAQFSACKGVLRKPGESPSKAQ